MAECVQGSHVRDESVDSQCSSASGSSSTGETERLRKLFETCDDDADGFLSRDNFVYMCKQLSLEEWTTDILEQLGIGTSSRISFDDFIRFRSQVLEPDSGQAVDETDTGIDLNMSRAHTQITSWPTMSTDSMGALSGRPDSLDYDSGARDLQSPEPFVSLGRMVESHDPTLYREVTEVNSVGQRLMDLANRKQGSKPTHQQLFARDIRDLHQASLTSLKGEILDLRSRLQRENLERDSLEKQLGKLHAEHRNLQDDCEERVDELTFRYEERITELHSVIAELMKKIERNSINVIKEEDEDDLDPAVSTKSQDGGSLIEAQSQTHESGCDLGSELSRVVIELQTTIHERKKRATETVGDQESGVDNLALLGEDDGVEEQALEVCKNLEDFSFEPDQSELSVGGLRPATFHPPPPPPPNEFPDPGYLQEEVTLLRNENTALQEQIIKQEQDLQHLRLALANLTEEKNKFKKQATEQTSRSPVNSRTSTPTKQPQSTNLDRPSVNITPTKASDNFPVAKVAELKKLKTSTSKKSVISNVGMPNTKVAEHLVQSLWKCSNVQEIVQNATEKSGLTEVDSRVTEFEIELERLQSQIDNYKSQIDVCNLTLEESKANCDRLTLLLGKYESNNTALQMVLSYSGSCIETYEIICALLESELGVVLANCRAAGLGSLGGESFSEDQDEISSILQRAHQSRRAAENVSKHLLHKLDKSFNAYSSFSTCTGRHSPGGQSWADLNTSSSGKYTANSSSGFCDTEFTKHDERRLRDYVHRLKQEQSKVHLTVMELESVYSDSSLEKKNRADAQRLDLENAVIMQELMAVKEEKADLKAQTYLLEKEKRSLELRLGSMQSQEAAYLVQIEHLKAEVTERSRNGIERGHERARSHDDLAEKTGSDCSSPSISLVNPSASDQSDILQELTDALKREKKLKTQVSELVGALEKLSHNSEVRHQQSAEFVNDLKRANSALISAFDKAKKKYQAKLKKLESQMQSLTERYESQIRMLKQRLSRQEEETQQRLASETSL